MASADEQIRRDRIENSDQESAPAEDPVVKIYLMRSDGTRGRELDVKRSSLVKESGFFRAMFRNECKESIENVVELHDERPLFVNHLMECVKAEAYTPSSERWGRPVADNEAFSAYLKYIEELAVCDKYDMTGFKREVLRGMNKTIFAVMREWLREGFSEADFLDLIWARAPTNAPGQCPEEMNPAFAFAWAVLRSHDRKTSRMDALMENDPKLALGVAKAYRHIMWEKEKVYGPWREAERVMRE